MLFDESELLIPAHWLSAIINGDESSFDYYDDAADYSAYQAFCAAEIPPVAIVSPVDDDSEFCRYHDARGYGVLPCDCVRCLILTPIKSEAS